MPKKSKKKHLSEDEIINGEDIDGVEDNSDDEEDELSAAGMHVEDEEEDEE